MYSRKNQGDKAKKVQKKEGNAACREILTWTLVAHPAGIAIPAPALNALLFLCAGGDAWDQSLRASGLHAAIERITADASPAATAAAPAATSTDPNQAASSGVPDQAPRSTGLNGAAVPKNSSVSRPDQATPAAQPGPDQATPADFGTGTGPDQATPGEAGGARPDEPVRAEGVRADQAGGGVHQNGAAVCPVLRFDGDAPSIDSANANGCAREVRALITISGAAVR